MWLLLLRYVNILLTYSELFTSRLFSEALGEEGWDLRPVLLSGK
jgi:hypothetical protein